MACDIIQRRRTSWSDGGPFCLTHGRATCRHGSPCDDGCEACDGNGYDCDGVYVG